MTNLEITIIAYENWTTSQEFYSYISENVTGKDLILFQEIWSKASDPEIWKGLDIVLGCKTAHNFIHQKDHATHVATFL